jgi:integrase
MFTFITRSAAAFRFTATVAATSVGGVTSVHPIAVDTANAAATPWYHHRRDFMVRLLATSPERLDVPPEMTGTDRPRASRPKVPRQRKMVKPNARTRTRALWVRLSAPYKRRAVLKNFPVAPEAAREPELTVAEFRRLVAHAPDYARPCYVALVITGLRVGEYLTLGLEHPHQFQIHDDTVQRHPTL